jgi:hypothetical protein
MIAAEIANTTHGGDRVSEQTLNSSFAPITQAQAAEVLKVGVNSVKQAGRLKKGAPPEIINAVKGGEMSLNAATKAITPKANKGIAPVKGAKAAHKTPVQHRATGLPIPDCTIEEARIL